MKKLYNKLFFLVILFIVSSCNLDNFDFNKLSDDLNISPEFVLPLAKANISVWDIIESVNEENDTLIKKGDNDVIKIVYTEEGIYDYQVSDFLDLPQQESFTSGNNVIGEITVDDISISKSITLQEITDVVDGDIDNIIPLNGNPVAEFPSSNYDAPPVAEYTVSSISQFTSASLSTGSLEISLFNSLDAGLTLAGDFFDTQNNQIIGAFSFINLGAGETDKKVVVLDGMTISNQIIFRMSKLQTIANGTPTIIDLNDYFKFDLAFKGLKLSSGNVKIEEQVITGFSGAFDFNFDDGVKVFNAGFNSGFIDIGSTKSTPISGSITLTFSGITKLGSPLSIEVPFGGSAITQNLNNALIDLSTDPQSPFNKVPYEYSIAVDASSGFVNFNSTDAISLDVSLSNLDFDFIEGDFGAKTIEIDNGNFEMDLAFFDKIEGDFKLANPVLKLILTNGIGVPAEVTANFTASSKDGQTVNLDPDPFLISTPADKNSSAVTQTVTIDKTNSNIVNFIALPPSGSITYNGNIVFNKNNTVTSANPNFFNLDAALRIDLGIDLPFELEVDNLTFSDTVKMDSGDLDMVKSAELIVNAINEIPLDIDMQLFFIDTISGQQYSSSTGSRLLNAAEISDLGVITAVNSSKSISLSESELSGLKKANGIVIKGIVSSPSDGAKVATIYSASKLDINVVIKSRIDL